MGALESDVQKRMVAFHEILKKKALSVTGPRLKIAEEVFTGNQHYTAEDLYDQLKKKGVRVGRVTVYRTLKLMVEAGLVEMRDFGGEGRFEPVLGRKHHDHLICIRCKKVVEFENDIVEREQERTAKREGFELVHHVHTLFGHCAACRLT